MLNVDKHVDAPWNVVLPDTFNDDKHVDAFCNVVLPETFNDDEHVTGKFKFAIAIFALLA